jgi:hypothetical protein
MQNKDPSKFIAKRKHNNAMIRNVSKTSVEQIKSNGEFDLYLYPLGI